MTRRAVTQLLRYTAVSGVTMALDLALVFLLVERGGWHYLAAVTAGLAFANALGFAANRAWTYRRRVSPVRGYLTTVSVSALCGLLILAGTALLVGGGLPYMAARVAAGVAAGILGYSLDSHFTFGAPIFFSARRR